MPTRKILRQLREEVVLVLAVRRSGDGDVVVGHLRVHTEALGDVVDALRAEGPFGICSGNLISIIVTIFLKYHQRCRAGQETDEPI